MDDFEKLYTVEDIARMTSFTSRTIRNYLKDGSLQGQKIGGQWRFTMENIKRLFGYSTVINDMRSVHKRHVMDFINGVNVDNPEKIQVCTIIDYFCENPEAGNRIYEMLVSVINARKNGSPPAKFNYDFLGKKNKARFTLFGDPDYVIKTLQLL